jgi:hypothetical protein
MKKRFNCKTNYKTIIALNEYDAYEDSDCDKYVLECYDWKARQK